jgi:hypothetical protein
LARAAAALPAGLAVPILLSVRLAVDVGTLEADAFFAAM